MPKANTIEEYLKLKAEGHENISSSSMEVLAYVAKNKSFYFNATSNYKIEAINNSYRYRLQSLFPFGKHKLNTIAAVYKCEPLYIEWCLMNASAFCVASEDMAILASTTVFNQHDLLIREIDVDVYEVDFSGFKIDENGFPTSDAIGNINFSFGKEAIKCNEKKLLLNHKHSDVLRGGDWRNESSPLFNDKKSKRIVIKMP